MSTRKLGKSDLEVSTLCLGGNVFGWTIDEARSFEVLDGFVDAGLNFIDTADSYSTWAPGNQGGESETIIGNWFKKSGKRDKVVIATKLGSPMGEGKKGLSKSYVVTAVEASLRRLQTDVIDLYQAHRDDESTPQEETAEAFAKLIEQGKVRAIGASNFTAERLKSALEISRKHGYPEYVCLQPHYNLVDRSDYETNLEPAVLAEGIGVIPYFALASGFLTGKYRSEEDLGKSARGGGVKKYLDGRGLRVLDALDQVSDIHDATPAQVALAWLIARPSITAPIASATSLEQLQDLVAATKLELSAEAISLLDEASA